MKKKKGFLEKELSPFWTWFIFAFFSIGAYEYYGSRKGFMFVFLVILYVLILILDELRKKEEKV